MNIQKVSPDSDLSEEAFNLVLEVENLVNDSNKHVQDYIVKQKLAQLAVLKGNTIDYKLRMDIIKHAPAYEMLLALMNKKIKVDETGDVFQILLNTVKQLAYYDHLESVSEFISGVYALEDLVVDVEEDIANYENGVRIKND